MANLPIPDEVTQYKLPQVYVNILEKLIHICFIGLMISISISKGAASTSMGILTGLSIIRLIVSNISLKERIRTHRGVAVLGLIYLPYLFSLLYTQNQQEGWLFLYKQNHFLLIPLIFIVNRDFLFRHFRLYIISFISGVCFAGIITILVYSLPETSAVKLVNTFSFLGIKPYEELSKRAAFGIYSPFLVRLQFGNILTVAIMTCCWMIISQRWIVSGILAFIILLIASVILGSRGSQLGMIAGLGVWFISLLVFLAIPRLKIILSPFFAYVLSISLFIFLFFIAPILLYQNVSAVNQRYGQLLWELNIFFEEEYEQYDYIYFTTLRRIVSWSNGWALVKEKPLWGTGVGDYKAEIKKVYDQDKWVFPVNNHNTFIFFWASTGLLGLITFISLLTFWTIEILRIGDKWQKTWGLSVIASYFIILNLDAAILSQVDKMTFCMILSFIGVIVSRRIQISSKEMESTRKK